MWAQRIATRRLLLRHAWLHTANQVLHVFRRDRWPPTNDEQLWRAPPPLRITRSLATSYATSLTFLLFIPKETRYDNRIRLMHRRFVAAALAPPGVTAR